MCPMSPEERHLRLDLDRSVRRIRSALARCPALDVISAAEVATAESVLARAGEALHDALADTAALEQLQSVSEESVLVTTSSRMALAVVEQVLALLAAELDGRGQVA
jgi:hypothetical protein